MMEVIVFLEDPRLLYQKCRFFGIGDSVHGPVGTMDLLNRGSVDAQTNRKDKRNNNCSIFIRLAIHTVNLL